WHPAALYCRELESRLGCPVQANAYYTPASAQGFAVHHDTHDVFVLQVSGSKRWRIYEPLLELPLKQQRWSPQLGDVGEPVDDLVLEAGDTLYLPRGWPHEAATSDEESLHITVGLHPQTRLDALRAALESCKDDVEFRRSVGGDGVLPGDLLERLAGRLRPEQVSRRLRRGFVSGRRPILDGQLSQVRGLEGLTASQRLLRRPTVVADLELSHAGAALLFDRKELLFPPKASAAVEALYRADGPLTAAELPGSLDEDGRLVLVRRLVREGFLQVSELL
ncbi:MAG: cupin domain-containing protein, partial [Actinomycetota bacterium]|nr:cupin domain-containing protein [Actinomycetota bacterium]